MDIIEKQEAKMSAVIEMAHIRSKYPGDILVIFRANKSQFASLLETFLFFFV